MNLLEIKHDRLSEPERFLHDIFDGLVKCMSIQYTDRFIYKKDNKVMFEYDPNNQTLWYSYDFIFIIFRDKYDFSFHKSNNLVQSMMETYHNLTVKIIRRIF